MIRKENRKRVTQQDVASAAGVSVMTVSNVVNGKTQFVGKAKLARVQEVIADLNYRPNVSAQRLRISREGSVGFVIVDNDPAFLSDPMISQLVSGLSNFLSANDYILDIQGTSPDGFRDSAILNNAGNDALCVILSGQKKARAEQLRLLERVPQPIVIFQETVAKMPKDTAFVRQDDVAGGHMIAQHLLTRKLRSVVFLRPSEDWSSVEQKEMGVRAELADHDHDIDFSVLCAQSEFFEVVFEAVKDYLIEAKPDAIIAATDAMAIAAIRACEAQGMRVPEDILVTGFSGYEHWRVMVPSLTTIVSPAYEMGRFAGELLLSRLKTGKFDNQRYVFPVSFRAGDSA